jgi:hypothetical protein
VQSAADAFVCVDALIVAFVRKTRQMLGALMTDNLLRTPGFGQLQAGELPCCDEHTTIKFEEIFHAKIIRQRLATFNPYLNI